MSDTVLAPVRLGDHFEITPAGLTVKGKPSFAQCEHLWEALKTLEKALAFSIGDALRYFEDRWGERASQIVDASGLSFETCRAYRWMAEKVAPADRRMDVLTPTHHMAVAKLPPREQREWLAKAADGDGEKPWPVARLKREIKHAGGEEGAVTFSILVFCESEADQEALARQLENLGRTRYKRMP
jgi:hypothetical protein